MDWQDVVVAADKALYVAKRNGRNRAVGVVLRSGVDAAEAMRLVKHDLEDGGRAQVIRIIQRSDLLAEPHVDRALQ